MCTSNFQWRRIYVESTIIWGSHILGPQWPIISFPNNFTNFFKKVRLVSETYRSDLSKEPIKRYYCCKHALEIIRSWWPVPSVRLPIRNFFAFCVRSTTNITAPGPTRENCCYIETAFIHKLTIRPGGGVYPAMSFITIVMRISLWQLFYFSHY